LREDKGWSIEGEIGSIARELFKEKSIDGQSHSRKQIREFFSALKHLKNEFETKMRSFGDEALKVLVKNDLTTDDFSYKSAGVIGYFEKIRNKNKAENYVPGARVLAGAESAEIWASKSHQHRKIIVPLVENTLQPILRAAVEHYEKDFPRYSAAVEVVKRIYLLGIVEDLNKKLKQYRTEKNILLISDTPKILSEVISSEEAPFVYEKAGGRYHHFLIDEFQDTSDLQWANLLPLIVNSLGEGNFAMVVGDVKQSIYRWRSGNMNLLANEIKNDLKNFRSVITEETLDTNYRSKRTIIDFNNYFFSAVPPIVNKALELTEEHLLNEAYSKEAEQKVSAKNDTGGYIEVEFFSEEDGEAGKIAWKDKAKEKLLAEIHKNAELGYKHSDMAVLVRNNREGDDVATFLIGNGITKVISPDSLLLSRSPKVRFLIDTFRYLDNKQNHIAQSNVLYNYVQLSKRNDIDLHEVFSFAAKSAKVKADAEGVETLFDTESLNDTLFNRMMPAEFTGFTVALAKLPVYELCEQLLQIFTLSSTDAYVLRFLDLILEYSAKHDSSVKNFLRWWDESPAAQNTAVITSESEDAIRIMTIHRSKGLQFPIVFMPFTEWKLQPDSRDVLWVSSEETPFNEFGKIPVSASKSLLKSSFKETYEKEIVLSAIDNVNLLYVAFTRAEEQLYIYGPEGNNDNLNSVSKLIRQVIISNSDWENQLTANNTVAIGEKSRKIEKRRELEEESFELKDYATLNWKEKIRLSTHSDELIEMLDTPAAKAINYGVLVHRVLSTIKGIEDVQHAVEQLYFEGLVNEEEKQHLEKEISQVLSKKEIAEFFSSEYKVMSEREIILPSGEMLRPDRVLIKDNAAIVIDFKTGKENKSHEKQLIRYADVLLQMGYEPVTRYLVYLSDSKVKQVAEADINILP
jgi:ATP-dependent helicase/nuclease subunit A